MTEDGVIKFHYDFTDSAIPASSNIESLEKIRKILCKYNLIGVDKHGIGYGNLSLAVGNNGIFKKFIISASQTGKYHELLPEQYVTVHSYDFSAFSVQASGINPPSSESLTHAAIYELAEDIQAVIHVHHKPLWDFMIQNHYPVSANLEYGTREMAREVKKMQQQNAFENFPVLAMKGHESGVIAFGNSLQNACDILMNLYDKVKTG